MPLLKPLNRKELIHYLKKAGFDGPYSGGKNQFLIKDDLRLRIPNPHCSDIGKNLLSRILKEAGISKKEWEKL